MTNRTIPKPPGRAEWLEARGPYVGASDAACLFGLHGFKTLAELAVEKVTGARQPDNAAMSRGRRLEPVVADWYAEETGSLIFEPDVLYLDPEGLLCSTLDRLHLSQAVGVEVKTTATYVHEPPLSWEVQAQVQMLCADLDRVDLAVLDASLSLSIYPIRPDAEFQGLLVERAREFLSYTRKSEIPPDLATSYRAVAALHPLGAPGEAPVELDDEAHRVVGMLRGLNERVARLDAERDALKGRLGRALGDATVGTYDGRQEVTWRTVKRRDLNVARLREDEPELAERYARETVYRSMRVVG